MYYAGKRLDTFEMALNQLLEYRCGRMLTYLDCVSLRCFGYAVNGSVKEWFRPWLCLDEAVKNLADETGLSLRCRKAETLEEMLEYAEKGVVIGPVARGMAVADIREYYYGGCAHFLFVAAEGGDAYRLFDPMGLPDLLIMKNNLLNEGADWSTIEFVYLADETNITWEPDEGGIYKNGLRFHGAIREMEKDSLTEAVACYEDSRANRIALQYGVMNFLGQTEKVMAVAEAAGCLGRNQIEALRRVRHSLYEISRRGGVRELPMVLNEFWELLENAE